MGKSSFILILSTLMYVCTYGQNPVKLWSAPYTVDYFAAKQTSFSYDSKYYAIGDDNGKVTIYETATGEVHYTHQYHKSKVFCTIFQPFGNILASSDKDGNLVLFDYVRQDIVQSVSAHEEPVTALCFSSKGDIVFTGSRDNYIKLWKAATGEYISMAGPVNANILALKVSPDNKTLVVGTSSLSEGITLYDIPSGYKRLAYETANIQYLDVSPDNKYIASANLQKPVNIWDMRSGQQAFRLEGHSKYLNSVAFSPAGDILASSGNDKTVNLWDFSKKTSLYSFEGDKIYTGLVFSPDGKYLAIMDEKPLLTMYDVSALVKQVDIAEQMAKVYQQEQEQKRVPDAPAIVNVAEKGSSDEDIITDIDGNEYKSITVKGITWMVPNLRVTKYSNGDPIPRYQDATHWSNATTGLYAAYRGDDVFSDPLGYLYNWHAVNDNRNICPRGWHVSSELEWLLLSTTLGGDSIAGGMLKSTNLWNKPNTGATNEINFTGLPAGICDQKGNFDMMGMAGIWWSVDFTANPEDTEARIDIMLSDDAKLIRGKVNKSTGLSVRCVKDRTE